MPQRSKLSDPDSAESVAAELVDSRDNVKVTIKVRPKAWGLNSISSLSLDDQQKFQLELSSACQKIIILPPQQGKPTKARNGPGS